jgi:hypothetical protein
MGKCRVSTIVATAFLISCNRGPEAGASSPANSARPVPLEATGTPRQVRRVQIATLPASRETNSALLAGRLTLEDGCLYVVSSGQRVLPAFSAAGIVWNEAEKLLVVGERRFSVGQLVRLTGGEPPNAGVLAHVQGLVPACDTSKVFIAGMVEPEG